MTNNKFYVCEHCGNLVEMVHDAGVTPHCCGQKMTLLVAGAVDASHEKHVPVVERIGNRVKVVVGSTLHPMAEEHSILWVQLQTKNGVQRKLLEVGAAPVAEFILAEGDEPVAVYAYCNLHGLWKQDL